jgi:putative flippase GtrA
LYGLVVLAGYSVDFSCYAVLAEAGANVYVANVLAFCVGATVNVLLLRKFVFALPRFSLGKDVVLTWMSNGMMFAIGMAIFWILIEIFSVNHYWAKLLSSGLTFMLNYLVRLRYFTGV